MQHIFDMAGGHKPDNPARRAEMPPGKTLVAAGLHPKDIFLDIGCGDGYFSLPAVKLLGPKGKVYALDISAARLTGLRTRIAAAGVFSIETIETGAYNLKLPDKTATIALLSDVLHEVEDKFTFLMEINRVLRTGARLSIIEWRKKDSPDDSGPPFNDRLEERYIRSLLDRSGFTMPSNVSISPSHDLYLSFKK